eukprot:TRINITY_DN2883_c0_g1_i1.p1 TRINITY_DN2883_c0_g1~~TRINITY_DN2883_c0_g1_i1.p1  ORF type:complete len:352 (-),score=75.82 TRINITY_DN2883_c0_g1_i1:168-1223(-)
MMELDPEDTSKANVYIPVPKYPPNSNGQTELPSSVSFLLNAANQLNPSAEIEQTHEEAALYIKSAALTKSDSDSLSDDVNSDPTSIDKRKRGPLDEHDKERKKKVRLLKNRQSAALSRQRKKEYISTIEQKCNTLIVENTDLQNQIKSFSTNTWQNKVENEQLENQLKELTKQNDELRRANDLLLKANEVMLKSAQLNYQNNSATLQFVAANTPHQLFNNSTPQPGSATSSNPNPNLSGNGNNNNPAAAGPVQGGAQLTPQQLQGLGGLLILHQSTNNNININNNSDTTNFVTNNNNTTSVQANLQRNPSENVSEDKGTPLPAVDSMKVDQGSSELGNASQATPMISSEGQ